MGGRGFPDVERLHRSPAGSALVDDATAANEVCSVESVVTFVSFAQNFEDVLLWRALHDVEQGRYLDIGAQDPTQDSVSLAFYNAGWRGVHVEATPVYAERLRQARPDEVVIEAAVTDATGPIEFYEIPETGLSTGKSDIAERHSENGYEKRKIIVPCVRLDKLLAMEADDFHWMKIDVEGMEPEVLRSWGKSGRRPWIVVVESTVPSSQEPTEHLWIDEMVGRGYREVHFDGLSRYFVHEAHDDLTGHFAAPPNVFDLFAVGPHHFSVNGMVGSLNAERESAQAGAAQLEAFLEAERSSAAQLRADLAQARSRMADLDAELGTTQEERRQAVSALESATAETKLVRESEAAALSRAVAAEQTHREAVHTLWRERQSAEEQLRAEASELERSLRDELNQAQRRLQGNQADLARLAERAAQLQEQLLRSDASSAKLQEQLRRSQTRAEQLQDQLRQSQTKAEQLHEQLLHSEANSEQLQEQLRRSDATSLHLQEQLRESDQAAKDAADRLLQERQQVAQAQQELTKSQAAVADAVRVIERTHAERPGRWHRIGRALGLARDSGAAQDLSRWAARAGAAASVPTILEQASPDGANPPMIAPPLDEQRNPYLRADSLSELCAWDDVNFVRCAYVTILGRQPDPEGETYYLTRIRRGHSKLEVLWQLRRSEDALGHDPGIAGLDKALRNAAMSRHWLIGWAIRLITRSEGDSGPLRSARAFANIASVISDDLEQHNLTLSNINSTLQALHGSLQAEVPVVNNHDATCAGVVDEEKSVESLPKSQERELAPREMRILSRLELLHSASISNGIS